MPLTATKLQTAKMLGVSDDTVDNLLHQRRLRRTPGNRYVHIMLQSIADYTSMPLEQVIKELREITADPNETIASTTPSRDRSATGSNDAAEKEQAA